MHAKSTIVWWAVGAFLVGSFTTNVVVSEMKNSYMEQMMEDSREHLVNQRAALTKTCPPE